MLYGICARAEELLQVNIEDLDLTGRCAPVKSKGVKPRTRRRGATHHEHVLEAVYWDAGTARLIRDRTHGPLFVTHRRPGPGEYLADRDVCPDTGLAWLSYDQARDLLDAATTVTGPGTGWDLDELRHSGLTHLGEAGGDHDHSEEDIRYVRRRYLTAEGGAADRHRDRQRHLPGPAGECVG
ncbi:hypothetical protein [Nocardia sp. CY41]|uniref:hypothetical protein n=1 Tax=Nocardia sp. CY41 TaxID=2608686 RepID=UPI001F23B772|nr:hypothetical protein [Nocardia sp. CY41]